MTKPSCSCILTLLCLWLLPHALRAQETIMHCTDSGYCIPSIDGLPRSKGLVIKQERVQNYRISSTPSSDASGSGSAEVDYNRRWMLNLRLPVLNREKLKVAMGLRYNVEEYRFRNASELDYPLYQNLEDKSLKSVGAAVYIMRPFKYNRYLLLRGSARLNGDYGPSEQPRAEFLKYSATALYGVKRNQQMTYAFGLAYSYTFGRATLYPVFTYYKSWTQQWGTEILLPVYARLRYAPNEHYRFYLSTELFGANYNLHLGEGSIPGQGETVFLEKSELRYLLSYEREVYDFLWFSLEAGARTNLGFNVASDYRMINNNRLLNNQLGTALVMNASIFLVAPKKFLE